MTSPQHLNYDFQPFPPRVQTELEEHARKHRLPSQLWYTPYTARVLAGRHIMPRSQPLVIRKGRTSCELYNRAQTISSPMQVTAQNLTGGIVDALHAGQPLGEQQFELALMLAELTGMEYGQSGPDHGVAPEALLARTVTTALPLAAVMYRLLLRERGDEQAADALIWLFRELMGEDGDTGLPGLWWLAGNFQQAMQVEMSNDTETLIASISAAMDSYLRLNPRLRQAFDEFLGRKDGSRPAAAAPAGSGTEARLQEQGTAEALEQLGPELMFGGPVCYFAGHDQSVQETDTQFRDGSGDVYYMVWAVAEARDLITPWLADGSPDPAYEDYGDEPAADDPQRRRGLVISSPHAVAELQRSYDRGQAEAYRSGLFQVVAGIDRELHRQIESLQQPVLVREIRRVYISRSRRNLKGIKAARWMIRRAQRADED